MNETAKAQSTPQSTPQSIAARVERLPQSWWHVKTRIIIGTATFFDAFDALAIAVTLPALVGLWKLSPSQIGLIISAGYVGQIVGALFFGWFAERFGRVKALICCISILSLLSLACAFAWDYESLLGFRTIQGIGLGGEVPIAAAYISEIAKANTRGRFVLLYESIFPVGLVAASLLAVWVVPHLGWQWMFIIGALPALLVFVLIQAIPESPRWLAQAGRLAEADAVVTRIERLVSRGKPETLPAPVEVPQPRHERATFASLFEGPYRKRTLVVWGFWFVASLVSYTLTVWLPTIYRTVFNMPVQEALRFAVVNNVVGLVGGLFAAFLVDIVGRRAWFIIAFTGAALPLLWLGYNSGALTADMVLWFSSACSFFANSLLLSLYVYTPEIYPTRSRALGTSVATSWQRIGSIVGPMLVSLALSGYGLGAAFAGFACASLLAALIAVTAMGETRQRVLEELSP